MVNVAKMTEVKNEIVTSDQVAIVDIKKDSGDTPAKKTGLVSFTVPKDKQGDNDLKNCQLGSAEENEKESTILLVSAWDLRVYTFTGIKSLKIFLSVIFLLSASYLEWNVDNIYAWQLYNYLA